MDNWMVCMYLHIHIRFIYAIIQRQIRYIGEEVDARVRISGGPDASARQQIMTDSITCNGCADECYVCTELSG
jgi:hypothetical protein